MSTKDTTAAGFLYSAACQFASVRALRSHISPPLRGLTPRPIEQGDMQLDPIDADWRFDLIFFGCSALLIGVVVFYDLLIIG